MRCSIQTESVVGGQASRNARVAASVTFLKGHVTCSVSHGLLGGTAHWVPPLSLPFLENCVKFSGTKVQII